MDVPPYTIAGGVPAKKIRRRFDEKTIRQLEALAWWDWPAERIARHIHKIQNGDFAALQKEKA